MSQRPDQIIAGKYRLIRRLARGGMGSVYKARHLDLDVDVALKFLRAESEVDEQSLARFKREGRAAAQLRSPHVVQVFDYGVDDETPYIAMELLEGEDLSKALERVGSLPLSEALELIEEAGHGLATAHAAGVVHRDIKPANIFLAEVAGKRVVKLLDFGIAKETAAPSGETTTGMVFGSPAYMSPEQARGGAADVRGDIWSLGAVLYRMVLGELPFSGANASDIVVKLCTEEPPSASSLLGRDEPQLDRLFSKVLAKDRRKRFASVGEFLDACRQIRANAPEPDRSSSLADRPSRPIGRAEETAALDPASTIDPSPDARRQLETPLRNVPSTTTTSSRRQRIAALIVFCLVVAALLLFLPRKTVSTAAVPIDPPHRAGAGETDQLALPPPKPAKSPAVAAPKASSGNVPLPVETGQKPTAAPTGDSGSAPSSGRAPKADPAPTKPKRPAPADSSARRGVPPQPKVPSSTQAEKPTTDPVFGLPVEGGP